MKSLIGTITVVGAVVFGVPMALAWADSMPNLGGCLFDGDTLTIAPVYDDTPVGRAMALCARHEVPNGIAYPEGGHPPYPHANGWEEACAKLARMWETTETAKRQREAVEQEKRDLEFVNGVAAGAK